MFAFFSKSNLTLSLLPFIDENLRALSASLLVCLSRRRNFTTSVLPLEHAIRSRALPTGISWFVLFRILRALEQLFVELIMCKYEVS